MTHSPSEKPQPQGCVRSLLISSGSILLVLGCILTYYLRSGAVSCSAIDQALHLTPCRLVIARSDDTAWIRNMEFTPNGQFVLITAFKTVSLWDSTTGHRSRQFHAPFDAPLDWSTMSPDGTRIAMVGSAGVHVVDSDTGSVIFTIAEENDNGNSLTFSPNGQWLAWSQVRSGNHRIRILDAGTGHVSATFSHVIQLRVSQTWFTPDSDHLIVWHRKEDNRVEAWNWHIPTDQLRTVSDNPLKLSPDGTRMITDDGRFLTLTSDNERYETQRQLVPPCGGDYAFLSHPDRLVTLTETENFFLPAFTPTMCVYSLVDGHIIWQSYDHGYCLAVSPDEQSAALCAGPGIQIWDIPANWKQ